MHLVHWVILLVFVNWFSQQSTSHKHNYRLKHFRSEICLIPWQVLINFCSLLWCLSIIKTRNAWLCLEQINHDRITLPNLNIRTFSKERNFSQRIFLKILFRFLLSTHQVNRNQFTLYFPYIDQSLDCTARLRTHVPVKNLLLLTVWRRAHLSFYVRFVSLNQISDIFVLLCDNQKLGY